MRAKLLAGMLGLSALLLSRPVHAMELHDPVGRLRMPLDVEQARVCVVYPEPMRDPTACEGLDLQSLRARIGPLAAPSMATDLLGAVVSKGAVRLFVAVQRYKADSPSTDDFVREVLKGVRAAVKPPRGILADASTGPDFQRMGNGVGERSVLRMDSLPDSDGSRRLTLVTDAFQGVGCFYVMQLSYASAFDAEGSAYETALLSGLTVQRPAATAPTNDAERGGGAWVLSLAVVGACGAGVASFLLRRRQIARTFR